VLAAASRDCQLKIFEAVAESWLKNVNCEVCKQRVFKSRFKVLEFNWCLTRGVICGELLMERNGVIRKNKRGKRWFLVGRNDV
jgi:hypothetical protein